MITQDMRDDKWEVIQESVRAANNPYSWQVNYSKAMLSGILKGRVYHAHLRFCTKSNAIFFAKKEGMVITDISGDDYRMEDVSIVRLIDDDFRA